MRATSRHTIHPFVFMIPDFALMYAALLLALRIRYPAALPRPEMALHLKIFSILFLCWIAVLFIYRAFEAISLRRYTAIAFTLLSAMAANTLIGIVYFYYQPGLILTPRRFLLLDAALTFVFLLAWHLLVKYLLSQRVTEPVYFFPDSQNFGHIARELEIHSYLGFSIQGSLSPQQLDDPDFSDALIVIGSEAPDADTVRKFYRLRTRNVSVVDHRQFYETICRRVYFDLNELWLLQNIDYGKRRTYGLVKRLVDIAAGLLLFAVFIATFIPIALAIKLTSDGPLFFVQNRVGMLGEEFALYKYRSMRAATSGGWTAVGDPRITAVGRFLRAARLDELPQWLNLLRGDISLVGPRPEQAVLVESVKASVPFFDERHVVKPGLTGWAQLHIYASNLDESKLKLEYDLYYIKYRSLLFDLEIILKTLYSIVSAKGR